MFSDTFSLQGLLTENYTTRAQQGQPSPLPASSLTFGSGFPGSEPLKRRRPSVERRKAVSLTPLPASTL